ncbi:MAG: sigma-70 family RNA polymerase sigma factor [Actinomycetota bacterium]
MAASVRSAAVIEGVAMAEAPLSFDGFFQEHHPRLFAGLCLTTGSRSEAEEIAQDAFVKVLERWDRVSTMEDPTGFLFRTAMNLFRKRYRRARLAERLSIPTRERDDAFAVVNDRDVLVRAMRGLTPHQRAAVVLTAIFDYSSEEAGRILGISDSTVRVLAGKGRAAMRSNVGDPA